MKKNKLKFTIKKLLLLFFSFSFLFFTFNFVFAASLYFKPAQGNWAKGDIFIEKLILDTEGEEINAVESKISYPTKLLQVKEISTGNSILELWTEQPSVKEGTISFVGGKPGGYNGKDGKIISIAFKVLKNGKGEIKITSGTKVLLNDGKGTEANLKTKPAFINSSGGGILKNEWENLLKNDKTPPLPFKIKLSRDPGIFGNKYFISFATTDRETGVDYYEVLETHLNTKSGKVPEWKRAESPYLLEDQSLQSEIMVKAVDKAGNERIAKLNRGENKKFILLFSLIFFISAPVIFFVFKKLKN